MSALRDGESTTKLDTSSTGGSSVELDWSGATFTHSFRISSNVSFWRRLWVVVSCIPRYLITGSVEVP